MRSPILLRFALVAVIALVLLVPLSMIRDKTAERRERAAEVQQTFAAETSGPQALASPPGCIPAWAARRASNLSSSSASRSS
jgi:inner membrane protein involved in colicin E2 resistance